MLPVNLADPGGSLVDSSEVEIFIWGVISQMGEYRSQVVLREVDLIRGSMGLKQ